MKSKLMKITCALALSTLTLGAAAEEVTALWITEVPTQGAILYEGRKVSAGDILPPEALNAMAYTGSGSGELCYQAVSPGGLSPDRAVFSLKGRTDEAPVAEDSTAETYRNLPITEKLKITEPEGQAYTVTLVRPPRRGLVTLGADGSFTYTPKKNKVGVDSFTFTAQDEGGHVSREATVIITIIRPSDDSRYADTSGSPCCFAAEWMKNTGIFTGETLGGLSCFSPQRAVTQGEWVTMLVKTLEIPTQEDAYLRSVAEDIPGWLRPYVAAAIRSGFLEEAAGADRLSPDAPASTADAAAMVCSALNLPGRDVGALRDLGLSLEESGPLTRANAARLLYAAHKKLSGDDPIKILN